MKLLRVHGFTLIELLVVIAIIGVLAALVTASISDSREAGRDARRQADLKEIAKALELYYLDHNEYPNGGGGSDQACWVNNTPDSCHPLEELLDGGYMSSVPYDPGANGYIINSPGCGHAQFYAYRGSGQRYLLGAVQERLGTSGCTELGSWSYFGSDSGASSHYSYQYYIKVGD